MTVLPRRVPLVLAWIFALGPCASAVLAQVQSVSAYRSQTSGTAVPAPYFVPDNRRPLDYSPRSTAAAGRSDMGGRPAPFYPPAPIWMGLYAGVHGGYGWGAVKGDNVDLGRAPTSGALTGLHVGYNWQQDNLVAGLEGDFSASWIDGHRSFASGVDMAAKNDWNSSLRLRLGYAMSNVLVYATGGVAFGKLDVTASNPTLSVQQSSWHAGWVAGAGVEYKLSSAVSLRGEILHYNYGSQDYALNGVSVPVRGDETVARAGLTFHMN